MLAVRGAAVALPFTQLVPPTLLHPVPGLQPSPSPSHASPSQHQPLSHGRCTFHDQRCLQNGTDPVKAAFEGEGFLGHLFDIRSIDKWISGSESWFPIHRDCGPSCMASTLHRKDLPFTLALMPDWTNQAVGYVSSLNKLKHRVAAMSPTDSNSVNRNCCRNGEFAEAAEYNPAYCNASCDSAGSSRDECMANHAGGGMNVQALLDPDVGCDPGELLDGTCAACLPGGAAAPYWCDKAGVKTAEEWIAEYMPEGQIGSLWRSQCKFRRQTWDTFVATTKLLHATLEAKGIQNQQAWIETEVNLYFDETKDKQDQPEWEEAIIGVFYIDMDSSGEWLSSASDENWAGYDSSNPQRLGAAMVEHYNLLHPKTPIQLYRAAAEPPQRITFWRAGKDLQFENYLVPVPLSGITATTTSDIIDNTAGGSERTDMQPWETGEPGHWDEAGQWAPGSKAEQADAETGQWVPDSKAEQNDASGDWASKQNPVTDADAAGVADAAAEVAADAAAEAAADAASSRARPKGRCTAHHGATGPCCGQNKRDLKDQQDVRPCPQSSPTCKQYVWGKRLGTCTANISPGGSGGEGGGGDGSGHGDGGQNIWGSTPAVGACHSTQPNDVKYATCSGWCEADKAAEHCRLCECRGCQRLTAACTDDAALSVVR